MFYHFSTNLKIEIRTDLNNSNHHSIQDELQYYPKCPYFKNIQEELDYFVYNPNVWKHIYEYFV